MKKNMEVTKSDERGWQVGKTVIQSLRHLFTNQTMCDVTFNIHLPDGIMHDISAHKLILSARSPVFEAMFSGNFAESSKNVDIVDAEVIAFEEMLRYIYCEEVNLTGNNVLQITNLAKKYMFDDLLQQCTKFVEEQMTEHNVCDILNHSDQYGDEELVDKCVKTAWNKIALVIKEPSFYAMSQSALLRLLECDRNGGIDECDILEACLRWAKYHGYDLASHEARDTACRFIYGIRFSSISAQQFTTHLSESTLLTSDEKCQFFCFLTGGGEKYRHCLAELGFHVMPQLIKLDLGSRYSGCNVMQGGSDILQIYSNISIFLSEVAVFGAMSANNAVATVDVVNSAHGIHIAKIKTTIPSDTSDKLYPIVFPNNTRIERGVIYTITTTSPSGGFVSNPINVNHSNGNINIKVTRTNWAGNGNGVRLGRIARVTFQIM